MEKQTLTLDEFEALTPQGQPRALTLDEFEALMPRIEQKAQSRGFLDTVKYFLGEGVLKPLARGAEAIPGQLEVVRQMNISRRQDMIKKMLADEGAVFGADISKRTPEQSRKVAELNKIVDNFDKIVETSKRMKTHWDDITKTGIEAPSEEFLASSANPFDKKFSFTRLAALGVESFPMLAMGAAISSLTKSPSAGAMFISMFDAAEEYNIAREKGLPERDLNLIFASDLLALTALETVPITTFMKGGRLPLQMFKVGLQEGGEEVLQDVWKNAVAAIGYDETRKVTEGVIESFLAGFISGGILGTFSPSSEVAKQLEALEEKGVDTDKMIDTAGRQIIDNAEKIVDNFSEKVGPEAVQLPEEEVSQNGNQENVEGISGQEQVWEEPIQADIIEESGRETPETGGMVQAQNEVNKYDDWEYGAEPMAAIPGEPIAFYKPDKSSEDVAFQNAKAQIVYEESEDDQPLGYKAILEDGTELQNAKSKEIGGSPYFETMEEAQMAVESHLAEQTNLEVAEEDWDKIETVFEKKTQGKELTLNEQQAVSEIEAEYAKERKATVDEIKKSINKKILFEAGEEFALIPEKLFAKKGDGISLDSLATELESSLMFLGYEVNADGLRNFIYDEIGQQSKSGGIFKPEKNVLSAKNKLMEINKKVKERDAGVARVIKIVEKRLGKSLTTSGPKIMQKIRPVSQEITLPEAEALKIKLLAMQKVSKVGEKAGIKKERVRLTDIINKKKAREEEADAVKKMFNFIDKVSTSGIPLEYADAINEIKESIGFYREGKKRVTSARNILSRGKAAALDPEIYNDVSELEKINAADMDVNDLIEVYDVIQQIYHSGLHQNKFMIANKMANFLETVKAGVRNIVKFGKNLDNIATIEAPPKRHGKWSKELLQKYFAEHRRPEAMLEEFDGFEEGENYKTVFAPLNEASLEKERNLDKAKERLTKILSEVDIFNLIHKKEKVAGVTRKLSRDEMVFIYANTFHPQNRTHLKGSGITEETIKDVDSKLTENEKNVVKNVVQYFSELYDSIDSVHSKLKGKHLSRVEGAYFPIQNLEDVGDIEQIELQIKGFNEFVRTGVAKGFTEARDIKSEKAYKQFSFMNTVFRHINQVEHYKAFALPLRDASKYFKHPSVKGAIIDNYGSPTYDVLNSWLENIARGRDKHLGSFWDDVVLAMRTNYVVAVLGGNLSTVIKQPISFFQGMGYIGKRSALNGLIEFMANPEKAIEFSQEKSTQMKHRAFAQERELQDIARGRSVEVIFKQNPKLLDYFKNPKKLLLLKQFIKEGSMAPVLLADRVTVTALWIGEYRKQMNIPGISEEAAIASADKAIRRTQPQSGLVHLPAVFQSDPVRKMFTLFKNQPNQNFNLMYDAVVKYGKGRKNFKSTSEVVNKLMMYWILSSFIYGLASRKRMPEDKKEIALDLVQGALGGMVGLSNIYDKVVYPWGSDNMLGALYNDASRIINTKDTEKKLIHGIDLIATVSGVPAYYPIKRLFTRKSLKEKLFGGPRRKKLKPATF